MSKNSSWGKGALAISALLLCSSNVYAASCCGGGSSGSLVLPKFNSKMIDVSVDIENYNGYWDQNGDYKQDPEGSELNQYRLNVGGAYRISNNWQTSVMLPYIWNDNSFAGTTNSNSNIGDIKIGLWYETFDLVTCVYKINSIHDLKPSIYLGGTLTLPTGQSKYSDHTAKATEITGRGFYRLDANLLIEKTVYPFTVTLQGSYGKYLERDVNKEFDKPVEPYKINPGDRMFASAAMGYTYFLDDLDNLTFTGAISGLKEGAGQVGGVNNPLSKLEKLSAAFTTAYASPDKRWIVKGTWSHAFRKDGWGKSFPTTDIFTLGVSYVFF